MKLLWYSCFIISISFYSSFAQAPDTLWVKYYSSGLYNDRFFSVVQTSDGGFAATGWADDSTIVVKTDSYGDIEWTFDYDSPGYILAGREIKQTIDNGFIIVGDRYPNDLWLCKLDSNGNYEWDKVLGGGWYEIGLSVDQTSDGGYIAVGYSESFSTTHNYDIWLLKFNNVGDTLWTKVIGGVHNDFGYSVQETLDGGIILGGETESFGAGASDIWLIKLDADGNTIWTRTYGGANYDDCEQAKQTKDGGYIIIGYTKSFGAGSSDCWLIKTDALGNTQWEKTFGGIGLEYGYSVDELENGGYIFSGITSSSYDMYLVRTDSFGNLIWSISGFSVLGDAAYSVKQTFDGGFIVAGYIYKYATLVRIAPENLVPSISVLSPNGGEELIIDSDYSINWNSNSIDTVRIEYTTDNGVNWSIVSPAIPASAGSYLWTVPNTPSNNCRVKITDKSDSSTFDLSNDLFTIRSALNSTINVLSPNGGEELTPETYFNINWNSVNVVDVKIELSITNGASWTVIIDSLPSSGTYNWLIPNTPSIQSLIKIIHLNDITTYDQSDSVFTITVLSDVEKDELPLEYNLIDNYPNPFNPSTTIKYQIPELSFVTVKVYDLLGNEIATLVNEEKPVGNYEVEFSVGQDSSPDIASGIYFYRIQAVPSGRQAASFVETKKMLLLK